MAKKIKIDDELYGKMTLMGHEYWKLDNKMELLINKKKYEVSVEIGVMYNTYLQYALGIGMMTDDVIKKYFDDHPEVMNKEKAIEANKKQKELYKKLLIDNLEVVEKKIEEAALQKREEMMENQTEESFAIIVGKEKAKRVFSAKTREEILDSLYLKRLRVMADRIEITCTCDWFSPSGGFSIISESDEIDVEMLYVDCMSI